jgi:hypothetical protein
VPGVNQKLLEASYPEVSTLKSEQRQTFQKFFTLIDQYDHDEETNGLAFPGSSYWHGATG